MSNNISYKHEDRQWDARINCQTDEYANDVLNAIQEENTKGKFKYILIGGYEIGTRSHQDDYGIRHVHIAAIFHNRCSKGTDTTSTTSTTPMTSTTTHSCDHQELAHQGRERVLSGSSEPRPTLCWMARSPHKRILQGKRTFNDNNDIKILD